MDLLTSTVTSEHLWSLGGVLQQWRIVIRSLDWMRPDWPDYTTRITRAGATRRTESAFLSRSKEIRDIDRLYRRTSLDRQDLCKRISPFES